VLFEQPEVKGRNRLLASLGGRTIAGRSKDMVMLFSASHSMRLVFAQIDSSLHSRTTCQCRVTLSIPAGLAGRLKPKGLTLENILPGISATGYYQNPFYTVEPVLSNR
jgi:hypothetical protein